jgi:predicted methyltransferase
MMLQLRPVRERVMSCSGLMFSLFFLSPCGNSGGHDVSEAVAAAVSNPQRPSVDLTSDANRKPAQVLSFFDIKPGMTVLDLFSGGGYYTELLNSTVGENGKVIAHTNEAYIPFSGEVYKTRYLDGRLAQTETIVTEANDIELEANSLDAALMILTWHDFMYADPENGWLAIDENLLLDKLCRAMKPGAVLGVIDHVANSGGNTTEVAKTLHRIDPQVVSDDFSNSCFTLEAEAEFLRNNKDDHTLAVFDPSIRGQSDRFVFRFVRN